MTPKSICEESRSGSPFLLPVFRKMKKFPCKKTVIHVYKKSSNTEKLFVLILQIASHR